MYTHIQAAYTIEETGKIFFTFAGGVLELKNNTQYPTNWEITDNAPTFYISFLYTALSNIDMNFGVSYALPSKGDHFTFHSPVAAGFGLSYKSGNFYLKSRLAATFLGCVADFSSGTVYEPLKLGLGIMPAYNFGSFVLHFNTGLAFWAIDSAVIGWHVNPYVTKDIGPARVFGGIRVESDGVEYSKGKVIEWGIPIGIQIEF
jgi:hypothetical protein